ncbi:hypothetical protein [Rhodococcus opacus]|uniref:Uncharacterized protein n=1 Tax=Rhodococcus opacus (strain B4) TaxID=632772 RepID=C1B980_RHOOB|nr:hypothetical protein [Rhodococcus opacus]BAH52233.1 hypothetical protein ROP_39860 [Rhodococcus opacus B4]
MYIVTDVVTDVVTDELPTVKHIAETKTIRITFGLNGHLSLTLAEAAHVVTELAAALGEAQGEEVKPLVRDEDRVRAEVEIREGLQ